MTLWFGYHRKELFLLLNLSIDDANFGQRWWHQNGNKANACHSQLQAARESMDLLLITSVLIRIDYIDHWFSSVGHSSLFKLIASLICCHHHHQSSVSLHRDRSCATFRISLQVKCMVLSSFSVDLLQVVLGLPCCLFPSGILVMDLGPRREGGFSSWSVILPSEGWSSFWQPVVLHCKFPVSVSVVPH